MSAQQNHTVWTGYLSPVTPDIPIGVCMIADAAGLYYVVATAEARAAAGRTIAVAGLTITAGCSAIPAVEIQTVGPCPPAITKLGAGAAGPIVVNDDGKLERRVTLAADDIRAGVCDEDGWAYLNFGGSGAGAIGLPGDPDKSLQYNAGGVFGGEAAWTRESTGRLNATTSGFITYGAVGGDYPANGLVRVEDVGEGQRVIIGGKVSGGDVAILGINSGVIELGEYGASETKVLGEQVYLDAAGSIQTFSVGATSIDASELQIPGRLVSELNPRVTTYSEVWNLQTTDGTTTTAFSWTIIFEGATVATFEALGVKSTAAEICSYVRRRTFQTAGGTITDGALDAPYTHETSGFTGCDATLDHFSTAGRARVTGAASTTIDWGGIVTRLEVTHA